MKEKGFNIIELVKGIAIVCAYPIMISLIAVPFSYLHNKQLYNILTYLTTCIIIILLNYKDLKKDLISFKKNYKSILKIAIKYWLIGLIIMISTSSILLLTKIPFNNNQAINIKYLKTMPIFEILTACIFAPIIEEIIFRKSFNKMTNNIYFYSIITGITFALFHVLTSLNDSMLGLLYIIPFGGLGIALSYIYKKNNNIIGNIIIHSFHNILSIIEMLLLIIL